MDLPSLLYEFLHVIVFAALLAPWANMCYCVVLQRSATCPYQREWGQQCGGCFQCCYFLLESQSGKAWNWGRETEQQNTAAGKRESHADFAQHWSKVQCLFHLISVLVFFCLLFSVSILFVNAVLIVFALSDCPITNPPITWYEANKLKIHGLLTNLIRGKYNIYDQMRNNMVKVFWIHERNFIQTGAITIPVRSLAGYY